MKFRIQGKDYTIDELMALVKGGSGAFARGKFGDSCDAKIIRNGHEIHQTSLMDGIRFPNRIDMTCLRDGKVAWKNSCMNLVTNQGLQHILDILFVSATTQIDPFYVGLVADNSAASYIVAGDTAASHAGWSEDTNYSTSKPAYIDVRNCQLS